MCSYVAQPYNSLTSMDEGLAQISCSLQAPPLNPCPVVLFCAAFIWECEGED